MYFTDSRLMFLHPTKTGGSTVEHHLMQELRDSVLPRSLVSLQYLNEDSHDERHAFKSRIMFGNYQTKDFPRISLQHACFTLARRLMGPTLFDAAKKVAIVRNPYLRIVSLFYFYGFNTESTLAKFVHDRLPLFARASSQLAVNLAAKQTLYTHQDGAVAVDLILRQEQMEESVSKLAEFLDVPIRYQPRARFRKSKASLDFDNYMDAYDERTRSIVADLYADDFRLLGYEP